MKKRHARDLSQNQSIIHFDVMLQHDWPIEQCLLHISGFFGGKTKRPCVDLFIHWLIKQVTNTCRNHFSRSYENRSNFNFAKNKLLLQNRNSLTRNFQFHGFFEGVNARRFLLFFLKLDEVLGNRLCGRGDVCTQATWELLTEKKLLIFGKLNKTE